MLAGPEDHVDARFEDDMIEIAADDNYLMLCGGRRMLFLEGAATVKLALDEVASFAADGDAVVVQAADGSAHAQPFPSAPEGFVADAVAKLNAAAEAWRA